MTVLTVTSFEKKENMDQRERVLSEAIQKNDKEKKKWNKYMLENEAAVESLEKFSKHITVDIMVPIGRKALIPGQLIHTNEVLVGQCQNYFTKCSATKAKEICQLRIKMSKVHVQKLEQEAELWQNKLVKPHTAGVFGDKEKCEIIENYNEEEEVKWREQHKLKLRKGKLEERKRREENAKEKISNSKRNEEIFQMLKEAESLEELQQELDKLEINEINDNVVQQLMRNELSATTTNKISIQRIAHNSNLKENGDHENKRITVCQAIVEAKHLTYQKNQDLINEENSMKNENKTEKKYATENVGYDNDDDDHSENEGEEKEIHLIKEQAKFLPVTDQVGFYEYQIQIIRQKISRQPTPRTKKEMNEKVRLFIILERLEELLEMAEEIVSSRGLSETKINSSGDNDVNIGNNNNNDENDSKQVETQRRVSFALEDDEIEFDKNVAITDICKSKTLSQNEFNKNAKLKKNFIKMNVEENRKRISEQQSEHDFNLIDRIMGTTITTAERTTTNIPINILKIKFLHSHQENNEKSSNVQEQEQQQLHGGPNIGVGKPSDFYDNYVKYLNKSTIYLNNYDREVDVQMPVLKEVDRSEAFENPKTKFSNPIKSTSQTKMAENKKGRHSSNSLKDKTKSILLNKSAVEKENHTSPIAELSGSEQDDNGYAVTPKKRENKSNPEMSSSNSEDVDDEYMTAYYKVMNDVVEKPLTKPDPLPTGNFIDGHAPKRRISRFNEMRQKASTTVTRAALAQQ